MGGAAERPGSVARRDQVRFAVLAKTGDDSVCFRAPDSETAPRRSVDRLSLLVEHGPEVHQDHWFACDFRQYF